MDRFLTIGAKISYLREDEEEVRAFKGWLATLTDVSEVSLAAALMSARNLVERLVNVILEREQLAPQRDLCENLEMLGAMDAKAVSRRGGRPPILPEQVYGGLHHLRVCGNLVVHPFVPKTTTPKDVRVTARDVEEVLAHLMRALEWYFEEYASGPRLAELYRLPAPDSPHSPARHHPGQLPACLPVKLKSDRKNILRDPAVSARLLQGDPLSWAECVMASRTVTIEVGQKNRPMLECLPYNHFVAPSALFSARPPGQARPIHLGYTRAAQPRDPGFRLTTGTAILWSASYNYDVTRQEDAPIDVWIEGLAQDRRAAAGKFVSGPECTLLQILRYKIALVGLDAVCEPLAVITNDLRNAAEPGGRVYTQYVFHVTLAAKPVYPSADLATLLSGIRVRSGHVYPLAADFQSDELVAQDGRRNPMDYLAWEGLHNDMAALRCATARFTRGFVVA
jgi:hypothetical protein